MAYRLPDGSLLPSVPSDLEVLESAEVVYETLPGWEQDISKVRSWEDMPENARRCGPRPSCPAAWRRAAWRCALVSTRRRLCCWGRLQHGLGSWVAFGERGEGMRW